MQTVSTHDQLHFYGKQLPLSNLYSLQLHACQYNTDEEGNDFPYSSAAILACLEDTMERQKTSHAVVGSLPHSTRCPRDGTY